MENKKEKFIRFCDQDSNLNRLPKEKYTIKQMKLR